MIRKKSYYCFRILLAKDHHKNRNSEVPVNLSSLIVNIVSPYIMRIYNIKLLLILTLFLAFAISISISGCKHSQRLTKLKVQQSHQAIVDSLQMYADGLYYNQLLEEDSVFRDYTSLSHDMFCKKYKLNKNKMNLVNYVQQGVLINIKINERMLQIKELKGSFVHYLEKVDFVLDSTLLRMDTLLLNIDKYSFQKIIPLDSSYVNQLDSNEFEIQIKEVHPDSSRER